MRSPIRRLTRSEITSYDVLPTRLARRVVLIRLPFLPGPYSGMTIGPLVFLAKTITPEKPDPLLAHELVHVRQFFDQGFARFVWNYNTAFVRGFGPPRSWNLGTWQQAYKNIPAEQEARKEAGEWLRARAAREAETATKRE